MTWSTTDDPKLFRRHAGVFLRSRPTPHTMVLSSLDAAERAPRPPGAERPVFGWWDSEPDPTAAAFVWTPGHFLAATSLPGPAREDLARLLLSRPRLVGGLMADKESATGFARIWTNLTGTSVDIALDCRLYALGPLTPPSPGPPGRAREAGPGDRDLLLAWCTAFTEEAGPLGPDLAAFVDERIAHGGWRLWEADGVPVAMAGVTRAISGTARVTPVYTPPESRGHGYATAVTAAVSSSARRDGAEHVVLFTDLTNPATNRMYQRIGYRPVADYQLLRLLPAAHDAGTARR